jgi:hypothetical protein
MIAAADIEEFLRPSSMEAIEACPGRPTMEARAVRLVPFLRDLCSEPARQGTKGHDVLFGVTVDAFAGDWSRAQAVIAGIEGRMAGLAGWTKDGVRACMAYVCALVASATRRFARVDVLAEEHLDGAGIDIPRGGTADLVLLCYDAAGVLVLVIIEDHKLGFVSQGDAADHLQLGGYAAMAADRWRPRDGVEVHLAAGRRHEFTSAHYHAATIAGVRARLKAAGAAARVAAPELRPCLKACRFCRALVLCRPAREFIMDARDQLALFGFDPAARLDLQDAASLAKRFAQDADAILKAAREAEADRASRTAHHTTENT